MSTLTINTISEKDIGIFSNAKTSKLILDGDKPSSPPLKQTIVHIQSGKRKDFQSKNDPSGNGISEKRISGRMPRYRNGSLEDPVRKLTPVKTDDEVKQILKERKKNDNGEKKINASPRRREDYNFNERKKNDKKEKEYERGRPRERKHESPRADRRSPDSRSPRRSNHKNDRKQYDRGKGDYDIEKEEQYNRGRERYSNRRDSSSRRRYSMSNGRDYRYKSISDRKYDKRSGRDKYRDVSDRKYNKKSSRRSPSPTDILRPRSPHRHKKRKEPGIKISGRSYSSEEVEELDTSTSSAISSRERIKETKKSLDRHLEKKYPGKDFYPEDDRHLEEAISIALNENRQKSISDAKDKGYDLNAKILESLSRPNELEEVIEQMVSDRRDRIRATKRRIQKSTRRRRKEEKRKKEVKKKNKLVEKEKARKLASQCFPEDEEIKNEKNSKSEELNAAMNLFDRVEKEVLEEQKIDKLGKGKEEEESNVAVIETIDEEDFGDDAEEEAPDEPEKDTPRGKLILVNDFSGGSGDESVEEKNIRLPRAERKRDINSLRFRRNELDLPDELGQQDNIYDPLGVDGPFGKDDDSVGDDLYEESSEDDSKLTINEKKDEMLYRFKIIKEAHPNVALPRITKRMKLAKMVRLYEHVMSRIKLKTKTNNMKVFVFFGFLAMQFIGGKFGLDTAGFSVNQMHMMKRYERFLREIGEADWNLIGVDLPVMIRLPIFMAINMGIFVAAKFVFKKTGKDYSEQFYSLYSQLTGGDDYTYINEKSDHAGLDAGGNDDGGGGDGGGIFGMIKSFMGMMGGSGGGDEKKPKRGENAGPTYKRRRRKKQ